MVVEVFVVLIHELILAKVGTVIIRFVAHGLALAEVAVVVVVSPHV